MDTTIEQIITSCPTLAVLCFIVKMFLDHMKQKDEVTKEMSHSIENLNITLVSIQKDMEQKEEVLGKLGQAVEDLANIIKVQNVQAHSG